jgi:DNA-binding MarR family transcriptional regulator
MPRSSASLPADRLAIGQLLTRLLLAFRTELFDDAARERFPGIRFPHLQIWGNVGIDGIRLTDLAHRANLSLAACSELVNELQDQGYLERQPDPRDGRAKLIYPTEKGREVLDEAGRGVARIERRWRSLCPPSAFDDACRTFDSLLVALAAPRSGGSQ